jgi:hypothetical protein
MIRTQILLLFWWLDEIRGTLNFPYKIAVKISKNFENRKVLKLFRFSYKIAKTANSKTTIISNNTRIWRLKFGLRVHNESYSILFTHFFDFKRKWFHMCRANVYLESQRFRFLEKSSYRVCTILNPNFTDISLKFRGIFLCTYGPCI